MDEDEINQMDVKEAFYTLQSMMCEEEDEEIEEKLQDTYNKARFGIAIKFDLYDHLNGMICVKNKSGLAIYRTRTIPLTDYHTEIERRTITMKKWLKNNMLSNNGIKPYK